MITQERLKELFYYDPLTGYFMHKYSRGPVKAGARAGASTGHIQGYRRLSVDYERIYEHQAAWLYMFGEVPNEVDHKDGNGSNNAIINLRPCDRTQNNWNSQQPTGESGLRGAYLDHRTQTWYSKIQFGGQVKYLGSYSSAEEAHAVFEYVAKQLHGKFYLPPATNHEVI